MIGTNKCKVFVILIKKEDVNKCSYQFGFDVSAMVCEILSLPIHDNNLNNNLF